MSSSNSGADSNPQVTVLMGVFNGLPGLEPALVSILRQSFTDFEFVIVDDGSTDGSAETIEKYARLDARIRLIRNARNVGLGAALNRGVKVARGQLVARMDADDIAMPDRLEKQVRFFRQHPDTDVLGSYALDIASDGAPMRVRHVPTTHQRIVSLVWSCPFIHPTVMFKREAIERVGSYSSAVRRRQDYELWFRCVRGGLRLANIPEPLVHYRFSEETMRRNHARLAWDQVKIGLAGCRMVGAPAHAYIATCIPLLEAVLPRWLRLRMMGLRARLDPRRES